MNHGNLSNEYRSKSRLYFQFKHKQFGILSDLWQKRFKQDVPDIFGLFGARFVLLRDMQQECFRFVGIKDDFDISSVDVLGLRPFEHLKLFLLPDMQ